MAFEDLDPLEKNVFKKPVTEMTAADLISYIKTYQEVVHEITLAIDPTTPRERAIFKGLIRQYGPDAGLIVKWVFWKYQGKWDGKLINFYDFQKSMKWWLDQMYTEMQEHQIKEREKKNKPSKRWDGFARKL